MFKKKNGIENHNSATKRKIIDGGGNGDPTLTIYATYAVVYGPDFQDIEDYNYTTDPDDIIQSTAKKYTGKNFIDNGNYGVKSYVSTWQEYPDGTYVTGSTEFYCYNERVRINLPNGSIYCDDEIILRGKATLGLNYPLLTSCTARIYCND